MSDALQKIEQLRQQAMQDLPAATDAAGLEQFRIRYLGSHGAVKDLMDLIKQAPADQKKQVGQRANQVKQEVTQAFESRKVQLAQQQQTEAMAVDVTEPGRRPQIGNIHILTKVIGELTDLFARMGFAVASGPEVEDEFHNFVALNIPEHHPARDPLDNFYLAPAPEPAGQSQQLLLRTQTSTVQIRVMQSQRPPIRVVIPGRVYRPDTVDQTHLFQFHQLEALVVDRHVTLVDLKSTIMQFVHAYFGPQTQARFRPSFFPFTEPSGEVDVYFEDRQRWIELGGCGMVHPNVLKACNIDPEEYSGWAFGFGIERIAMRRYGIGDIRLFVENDVRFLRQF